MTGDERITFVSEEEALRFAYAMDAIAPGVLKVDRLGIEVVVSGEALEYLDEALARVGFGGRTDEEGVVPARGQPAVGELQHRRAYRPLARIGIVVLLAMGFLGAHPAIVAPFVAIAIVALLFDHRRGSARDTEVG